MKAILVVILILDKYIMTSSFQYSDVERLVRELFDEDRYKKHIRPMINQTKHTQVNVSLTLTSIKSFDLSSGSIVSTGYLRISWYDEMLVWQPKDFTGISTLTVPYNYNWRPVLTFAEGSEERSLSNIFDQSWVSSNGAVIMVTTGDFRTMCELDTTHYPFDSHSCDYQISTNYDISEVILMADKKKIELDEFVENGEWYILETECKHNIFDKKATGMRMSTLSNVLVIKRRSAFVLLHTLCPVFLLNVLGIVVCLVPVDSGERVSFSVTVFLSFVFLSSSIVADLPRNALKLTSLSIELLIINILTTLNVLWSIYIVRLSRHHCPDSHLPWFFKCVSHLANNGRRNMNVVWRQIIKRKESVSLDETDITLSDSKIAEKENVIDPVKKWSNLLQTLDLAFFVFNLICYGLLSLTITIVFVTNVDVNV